MPSQKTGITFTNLLGDERSLTNQVFLNGSGVAAGDVDGDGLWDLYFAGLDSPNALYRNLGNWRFEDITASAGPGVDCADQASTGVALADLDGDGDLDLLVNSLYRGPRFFRNNGRGVFTEFTDEAGVRAASGGASFAIADVDGDGWLDVYVVNYRSDTMRDMPEIAFTVGVTNGVRQLLTVNGRPASEPDLFGRFEFQGEAGVLENGEPDVLFRNIGGGLFAAQDWLSGAFTDEHGNAIDTPFDWGLSALFHDLNGDGAPDLYVCNDFQSPDRAWINDGRGRFRALPLSAMSQSSLFSMGVDAADLDRDGHVDFFVADMLSPDHRRRMVQVMDATAFGQYQRAPSSRPQVPRNTLFRARGDGSFAEVARMAGLDASDWTWSAAFLDVDLDGFEDLLVATGHWRDVMNADIAHAVAAAAHQRRAIPPLEQLRLRRQFPRLDTANLAFRNLGNFQFKEHGADWGFDSRRVSHGMAFADLDNDGDMDVVLNCLNDGPLLLRNQTARPRVAVRLRGVEPNAHGIGARISVRSDAFPVQTQEIISGGRYLSSDQPLRTFAAPATGQVAVHVTWRSGRSSVVSNIPPNSIVEIFESEASPVNAASEVAATPLFTNATHRLRHQHLDEPFDDFAAQPLLPRRMSELGPGLIWFDFNGDGWDDLLIGSGRGGRLSVFRNDRQGGFIPQRSRVLEPALEQDITGMIGWLGAPRQPALFLGLANDDNPAPDAPAVRAFSLVTGRTDDSLAASPASSGHLALADIDGDGDLDLFIGGRFISRRYPQPAPSLLLIQEGQRFQPDARANEIFATLGLVSGAVFTDLDDDARPELVVACEWGPLRIFRFEAGQPREWNPAVSGASLPKGAANLSDLTGWWNSVTAADLDGDGRMDLVAGNLGRNTSRRRHSAQPIHLHFTDAFSGENGPLGLMESRWDAGLNARVPRHDLARLAQVFPVLPLAEGGLLPSLKHVSAAMADSVVLLNRGDRFECAPLPWEAQVSPVFGIAIGDFDGDGPLDLALAQNAFGLAPEEGRYDAGIGVLLRGVGDGTFVALGSGESGVRISGEGRAAAVCDFNRDGRLDLAVSQYRGPTLLFENTTGKPGLRVRLQGPDINPAAIGARVRLIDASGRRSPAREIRAGEGYWSQNAAELVLSLPGPAQSLEIRWPDGITETVPIPNGATEVTRKR
jgi:hypothetical protein